MLIAPTNQQATSPRTRRLAATIIAGVVSVALAVVTTTLGGSATSAGTFVLFVLSLPWTVALYVLTMIFNVTSPVAIGVVLALVTLLTWRFVSRLIARFCLTPRED